MKLKESEKLLERKLKALVENQLRGWCIKLVCTHLSGLPDRMCLLPGGRVLFVEVKTTGKKLRLIQKVVRNKIKRLGFEVHTLDNTAKMNEIFKPYK